MGKRRGKKSSSSATSNNIGTSSVAGSVGKENNMSNGPPTSTEEVEKKTTVLGESGNAMSESVETNTNVLIQQAEEMLEEAASAIASATEVLESSFGSGDDLASANESGMNFLNSSFEEDEKTNAENVTSELSEEPAPVQVEVSTETSPNDETKNVEAADAQQEKAAEDCVKSSLNEDDETSDSEFQDAVDTADAIEQENVAVEAVERTSTDENTEVPDIAKAVDTNVDSTTLNEEIKEENDLAGLVSKSINVHEEAVPAEIDEKPLHQDVCMVTANSTEPEVTKKQENIAKASTEVKSRKRESKSVVPPVSALDWFIVGSSITFSILSTIYGK